jgi:hypothetical protein
LPDHHHPDSGRHGDAGQGQPELPYDEAGKRSIEAAVLNAQPLPYRGFESVFARTLNFTPPRIAEAGRASGRPGAPLAAGFAGQAVGCCPPPRRVPGQAVRC